MKTPERAIEDALDKLDIRYIDMMLLHHPGDNDVKAYKAMEQAVADGKIHSIGLSNWYKEELEDFLPQVSITLRWYRMKFIPIIRNEKLLSIYKVLVLLCRLGILWGVEDIQQICLVMK